MKLPPAAFLGLIASASIAFAADRVTVTVTHDLDAPRPAETIAVPWADVAARLPGILLQHLAVKDAAGHALPYQVTNIAPEAKDPHNQGIAYGELLFQHDFAPGEKSATFTIEKTDALAPVFPSKVFARYVPERLDDFAWENDKVAHRTYGPALAAPDTAKRGKEVLVTSGLDIWCKRVDYLVVDRWYNKGHDHYHHDEGEGMDMYNVGTSCGAGGTGIWQDGKLHVGRNYASWKVIANGPIRAIFELTYDTWTTGRGIVSEVKRFTVDAGTNFDRMDSTFTAWTGPKELTVAIGLNKNSGDKGQDAKVDVTRTPAAGWLAQWEAQKTNGSLGEAIVVPENFESLAEDEHNQLVLAHATSGKPLRYYLGAGWSKAGEFTTRQAWDDYVAAFALRLQHPVKVTLTP